MKPCKVCNLETDCEHRNTNPVLSGPATKPTAYILTSGHWKDNAEVFAEGYNAGLKRAVEIVKEISKSNGD